MALHPGAPRGRELGATLAAPATLAIGLMSGEFAIGAAAYLRWKTPESTATFAWTFWIAPSLRF